jgi:hypothetical protein
VTNTINAELALWGIQGFKPDPYPHFTWMR